MHFKQQQQKSTVIKKLNELSGLPPQEQQALEAVTRTFEFRVSRYYADLIDWADPQDPLRRLVLPHANELESDLEMDASHEAENIPVHGLQHKYRPTALLLVNDVCASYCRFCFRKRFTLSTSKEQHILFDDQRMQHQKETTFDVHEGIDYIKQHPEIHNVLLTGGDPLMLSVGRLEQILEQLRAIPHVRIIRIGTKVPAFDPERISEDLLDMLSLYSTEQQRIYLIVHFNHPRELTPLACHKLDAMLKHGLVPCNQSPLLRGINDQPDILVALHSRLAEIGVTPYYLFHCRPTRGNEPFMLSLQDGLQIVNATRARLSGLAKRFRYVGSHASGKIEIVGQLHDRIILRYHEARNPEDENRLLLWPADRPIFWFDEIVQNQGI